MRKLANNVVWMREKKLRISLNRWPEWQVGYDRLRYDGLIFWALHLGPICLHNDFVEAEDQTPPTGTAN